MTVAAGESWYSRSAKSRIWRGTLGQRHWEPGAGSRRRANRTRSRTGPPGRRDRRRSFCGEQRQVVARHQRAEIGAHQSARRLEQQIQVVARGGDRNHWARADMEGQRRVSDERGSSIARDVGPLMPAADDVGRDAGLRERDLLGGGSRWPAPAPRLPARSKRDASAADVRTAALVNVAKMVVAIEAVAPGRLPRGRRRSGRAQHGHFPVRQSPGNLEGVPGPGT